MPEDDHSTIWTNVIALSDIAKWSWNTPQSLQVKRWRQPTSKGLLSDKMYHKRVIYTLELTSESTMTRDLTATPRVAVQTEALVKAVTGTRAPVHHSECSRIGPTWSDVGQSSIITDCTAATAHSNVVKVDPSVNKCRQWVETTRAASSAHLTSSLHANSKHSRRWRQTEKWYSRRARLVISWVVRTPERLSRA